ncbi:MAG: hypothetical protein AAGF89_01355 [Bacteroidota bacterium]
MVLNGEHQGCPVRNPGVELVKFGERFNGDVGANPEPSPGLVREGVET